MLRLLAHWGAVLGVRVVEVLSMIHKLLRIRASLGVSCGSAAVHHERAVFWRACCCCAGLTPDAAVHARIVGCWLRSTGFRAEFALSC
eukprot:1160603-Pelagomonas_calceolata.AAC.3